jgi:hypothetical protein
MPIQCKSYPKFVKSDKDNGELSRLSSFQKHKYLDKDITKQFILGENWELLQEWVSYNLKKRKPQLRKKLF